MPSEKRENMVQVNFRCPADLLRVLKMLAKANERSLGSEVIFRLKRSLKDQS